MEDQLIITIDYETAPRADDLGELFAALARDYKDFTKGRVLVVASIEHGSIIATLTDWAVQIVPYAKDAVEFAKGAKALADFGKILKEWIDGAKTGKRKLPRPRSRKTRGQRSIEAIVNIAADNGRALRLKHTSANGETFEVEMSGPQATTLRDEMLSPQMSPQTRLVDFEDLPHAAGAKVALPDLSQAIDRLYQPGVDSSSGDIDAIIDAVVEVLRSADLIYLIPQIVADLSNRGMHAAASALEARAHNLDGKHEPPLTTM